MTPDAPTDRRFFLDWLRIAAFGLLVLYHVGMYFVPWDWHVKSPQTVAALEPWMRLSNPWRMSLLFLLSGAATAWMLARPASTSASVLRDRSRRLLLPLLLGVALIVPPQSYFEVVDKTGYAGSYRQFLGLYFSGHGGFCPGGRCIVLPTWNHLWFLPYLWCYTVVLVALPPRWLGRAAAALDALPSWALLLLPALLLAVLRVTLLDRFRPTHALIDDPLQHASFGFMFLLGAALAMRPALFMRLQALRWPALGLALAAWALPMGVDGPVSPGLRTALRGAYACMQWTAIVAALGFAQRHLDRDHRWRAPLNEAVFPVYLVHQTLIIGLAVGLRPLDLSPGLQALLIIGGTLLGSLLFWRLARHSGGLRPWLGLPIKDPWRDTRSLQPGTTDDAERPGNALRRDR